MEPYHTSTHATQKKKEQTDIKNAYIDLWQRFNGAPHDRQFRGHFNPLPLGHGRIVAGQAVEHGTLARTRVHAAVVQGLAVTQQRHAAGDHLSPVFAETRGGGARADGSRGGDGLVADQALGVDGGGGVGAVDVEVAHGLRDRLHHPKIRC